MAWKSHVKNHAILDSEKNWNFLVYTGWRKKQFNQKDAVKGGHAKLRGALSPPLAVKGRSVNEQMKGRSVKEQMSQQNSSACSVAGQMKLSAVSICRADPQELSNRNSKPYVNKRNTRQSNRNSGNSFVIDNSFIYGKQCVLKIRYPRSNYRQDNNGEFKMIERFYKQIIRSEEWRPLNTKCFDQEMHGPQVGVNNLGKDNSDNVGNNLVPIQIQRRGLMGFSEPKTEGFAVPKTVTYQSLSLNFGYGLAAFIIANKPGSAAFIIANRLALWVKFYNEYQKARIPTAVGKLVKKYSLEDIYKQMEIGPLISKTIYDE